MKMNLKSVIICILIFTVITGICACKVKKANEHDDIPELLWLVPGDEQADKKLVLDKVNELIVPEIGAKLNIEFISEENYSDTMKMYMASGRKFDLCFTSDWLNSYDDAVRSGAFYDITEFLNKSQELKNTIPDYVFRTIEYEGKIYAMPNIQIMAQQLALEIQEDLIKKYSFDLSSVNSIDDIEPFLKCIKQNEPDIYPYRDEWAVSPWVYNEVEEFGNTNIFYNYKTGKIAPYWETPEVCHAVERLRDWYKKGYIRSDLYTRGDDTKLYNDGKYAVGITTWKPGQESFYNPKTKTKYVYKTIGDARKKMLCGEGTMTAIGINSDIPEKAFELLKLVNTNKQIYTLICNGIEGIHYTLDADGKMTNIAGSGYNPNADWKFGNQFNAIIKVGMDNDVWEKTKLVNEQAKGSELIGFKIDKSKIGTDLLNIIAVNEQYLKNGYIGFIVNDKYDDYINEYEEKMKLANVDSVVKEIARQADEYIKDTADE